jgi:peptide/nickel transport system permease protein
VADRLAIGDGLPHVLPTRSNACSAPTISAAMFARVANGARVSLLVGVAAAAVSAVLGVVIGSLAGFTGGKIDEFFMRVAEAFQIVPQFFLAILVVALFGASLTKIVLVIAILSWSSTARIIRAEFLKLRDQGLRRRRGCGGVAPCADLQRDPAERFHPSSSTRRCRSPRRSSPRRA